MKFSKEMLSASLISGNGTLRQMEGGEGNTWTPIYLYLKKQAAHYIWRNICLILNKYKGRPLIKFKQRPHNQRLQNEQDDKSDKTTINIFRMSKLIFSNHDIQKTYKLCIKY